VTAGPSWRPSAASSPLTARNVGEFEITVRLVFAATTKTMSVCEKSKVGSAAAIASAMYW
jgi:hypothetical protein